MSRLANSILDLSLKLKDKYLDFGLNQDITRALNIEEILSFPNLMNEDRGNKTKMLDNQGLGLGSA